MNLSERRQISMEAESLLTAENKQKLEDYESAKETLAADIFGVDLLDLDDNKFEQICNMARDVTGAEKALNDVIEIEDWLIVSRRK